MSCHFTHRCAWPKSGRLWIASPAVGSASPSRGWRPEDFVLAHSSVADSESFEDQVQLLRRLWAGERVEMRAADGTAVEITTFPRPLRPRLPLWLTAAGRVETFQLAGRLGLNLLTHMLGQDLVDLGAKVAAYRRAWVAAGHRGRGVVTLMMHTFVTAQAGDMDATVSEALRTYLSSSLDLIGTNALQFPTFAGSRERLAQERLDTLSAEDREALLEHAADRIRSSAGLIGDVDSCLAILAEVADADVDELACLIDFGVEQEAVLEQLTNLEELRTRHEAVSRPGHATLGELMIATGVTHLQMTPSQVRILLADESGRKALSQLKVLVLGGEAVPTSVVAALREAGVGTMIDMYGPTETTVWSTSSPLDHDGRHQIIGRPLANTMAYVLDRDLVPVRIGSPGDLWIGGLGVARGYLGSPELSAEAFRPDPFDTRGGRMYRTGDLARWRSDGQLEYLGRADQQVKVSGHRIEPAEIEHALEEQPDVAEAVVVPGEGADGSLALVAHVVAIDGRTVDVEATRAELTRTLPRAMLPAIVLHDQLPHTANGKVDRTALSRHRQVDLTPSGRGEAPTGRGGELAEIELTIKDVWCRALERDDVGVHENFLDLGGTSLLAVHVRRELEERLARPVRMALVFQHPTIAALARHLCDLQGGPPDTERGDARRSGMERLRERRSTRPS